MRVVVLPLLLASSLAVAQSGPSEFPEGTAAVAPEALKDTLTGKVFTVKPARGPDWRL